MTRETRAITPPLSDDQWHRLERYGVEFAAAEGEVLFAAGDQWYPLVLVETGWVEVVRPANRWFDETVVA